MSIELAAALGIVLGGIVVFVSVAGALLAFDKINRCKNCGQNGGNCICPGGPL